MTGRLRWLSPGFIAASKRGKTIRLICELGCFEQCKRNEFKSKWSTSRGVLLRISPDAGSAVSQLLGRGYRAGPDAPAAVTPVCRAAAAGRRAAVNTQTLVTAPPPPAAIYGVGYDAARAVRRHPSAAARRCDSRPADRLRLRLRNRPVCPPLPCMGRRGGHVSGELHPARVGQGLLTGVCPGRAGVAIAHSHTAESRI